MNGGCFVAGCFFTDASLESLSDHNPVSHMVVHNSRFAVAAILAHSVVKFI